MATVAPPPSKRQRREEIERTVTQQDVAPLLATDLGSFKANFVDSDGNQMADVIEINFADATEKNVSTLLNTLLERVCAAVPLDPVSGQTSTDKSCARIAKTSPPTASASTSQARTSS
jgi:hypothetical protein